MILCSLLTSKLVPALLTVLIASFLAGCTYSPFDGKRVGDRTLPIALEGYHYIENQPVQIEAFNFISGR